MPAIERLLLAFLLLTAPLAVSSARAQEGGAPEVIATSRGPVVIDTRWFEGTPRRAEVDLVRGETRVRAFEGRTVRTAAAANGEAVAVGYYHGGPEPFAGIAIVDLTTGRRTDTAIPVAGARSPHRPMGLVIASEEGGFAIVMQEQQADPTADVRSVFARIALDGTWREAPRAVAIPWGLAALAARGDGTYELAVLFGGFGQAQAGQARVCIVSLRADGSPAEHPWWASANTALTDVRLAAAARGIDLFYRTVDGSVVHHAFATDSGWGREPPAGQTVLRLAPTEAFYLAPGDTGPSARSLTP